MSRRHSGAGILIRERRKSDRRKPAEGKAEAGELWHWQINESDHHVTLFDSHHNIVMDFVRWGMGSAAPRFNDNGIMRRVDEFATIVPGREHHASWFKDIDHPTARLIAQAPHALTRPAPAANTEGLRRLQTEQVPWVKHNFGDRPSWMPLLGAVEELGELAHAHLKQAQGIRVSEDHDAKAKDAVADVVIYLADYCTARGYDLESLVMDTWDKVKQRDWKAHPADADAALRGEVK